MQPPVLAWYCLKGFRLLGGTQSVLAMIFLGVVGSVLWAAPLSFVDS